MATIDALATTFADILEQHKTGAIDETGLKNALVALIPDLAPTEWEQLQKVNQVFGRIKGMMLIEGSPSPELGLVGSSALDIVGKVFWGPKTESGWGDGVALSTDGLNTNSGFTLIKYKRGETGTYGRTAAQMMKVGALDSEGVSLMHWINPDYDEAILDATNGDSLTSEVQAAFDNIRDGVALVFPPNGEIRTNATIENPRAIPIIGNNCKWRGFFGTNVTDDLLLVEPTGERRGFFVRDLYAAFSTGGRNVLHMTSNGTTSALLEFEISGGALGTVNGGEGAGWALSLDGLGTHFGAVRRVSIMGGVQATCADRITYEQCLLHGLKAFYFDLIPGAYSTVVRECGIVARDGSWVAGGANIFLINNQIEQFPGYGANTSTFGSQLTIYGEVSSPVLNCVLEGNNFGGGANCLAPVSIVANVERLHSRNNQYNAGSSSYDVRLLDSSAKYCTFDEQLTRGSGRDSSEPLSVYDLGTATRGIWKDGADLTFENGWTAAASFGRSIDAVSSVVHLSGGLVVGSAATTSSRITTLPEGYRPRNDTILTCSNNADNNISRLKIQSNGEVYPAGAMPAAGSIIYLPSGYRTKTAASVAVGA